MRSRTQGRHASGNMSVLGADLRKIKAGGIRSPGAGLRRPVLLLDSLVKGSKWVMLSQVGHHKPRNYIQLSQLRAASVPTMSG